MDHLFRQAQIQDSLLQSYRLILFITQCTFLIIGFGIFTAHLFTDGFYQTISLTVMQIVLFLISIFVMKKLLGAIHSRQMDVDYFQKQIVSAEKQLGFEDKILTCFKTYQKTKNKIFSESEINQETENAIFIDSLFDKSIGHTRMVLDRIIPGCFIVLWVLSLVLSFAHFISV